MKTGRILITGTQGFIGSRLLPLLCQLGHTCVATEFDLLDFASADAALAAGPWDAVLRASGLDDRRQHGPGLCGAVRQREP